ncbi:hypothetical protein ACK3TF_001710 [Chlorella vulgaris]
MAAILASSAALATPLTTSRRAGLRSALPAAACRVQRATQRRSCVVRAAAQPEETPGLVADLARNAEKVFARYDFLSAGMGAIIVTGFCAARGQDVGTALWITAAATIVALLVNDMLPEDL